MIPRIRRSFQKELVTNLGQMLLQGKVRDGQMVVVDYDSAKDGLTFEPRGPQPAPAQEAPAGKRAGPTVKK